MVEVETAKKWCYWLLTSFEDTNQASVWLVPTFFSCNRTLKSYFVIMTYLDSALQGQVKQSHLTNVLKALFTNT